MISRKSFALGLAMTCTMAPTQADPSSATARAVIDTYGHVVTGTINTAGDIVNSSGQVIGHAISGTMDSTGNILDDTGRVLATVTGSNSPTVKGTATATPGTEFSDALASIIDARRLDLEREIGQSLAQGKIKAWEADGMQKALQQVSSQASTDRTNLMAFSEATALARQLDQLEQQLSAAARLKDLPSLMAMDSFGALRLIVNPPSKPADNKTTNSASPDANNSAPSTSAASTTVPLGAGTPQGLGFGSANTPYAANAAIPSSTPLPALGAASGGSPLPTTTTATTTAVIPAGPTSGVSVYPPVLPPPTRATSVDVTVGDPQYMPIIDARRAALNRLINNAVSGNQLTSAQTARLRAELDRIGQTVIGLKANGTRITVDQALALARDLDALNSNVSVMADSSALPALIASGANGTESIVAPLGTSLIPPATTVSAAVAPTSPTPNSSSTNNTGARTQSRNLSSILNQQPNRVDLPDSSFQTAPTTSSTSPSQSVGSNTEQTTTQQTTSATASGDSVSAVMTPEGISVSTGHGLTIGTAHPEMLAKTIDAKRQALASEFEQYRQSTNKLNAAQVTLNRSELQRIQQGTTDSITPESAVLLAEDLDRIGAHLQFVYTWSPSYVPIINGTIFALADGLNVQMDDLAVRRAGLEGRIEREFVHERLSAENAAALRSQMQTIANMEALNRQNGSLTDKEIKTIYQGYDQVAAKLEKMAIKPKP